ncbi:MAG TPA: glycosyltransferase family 4 protein [Candidatus Sulfotelmatobacter sp.]
MKILYVSQYFPPEMGAPAARASELARHWTQAGHEVSVLTGFPNHPTGIVPAEWRTRLRRLTYHEKAGQADVFRTWLWPLPNRKVHERMRSYASFCFSAALRGMSLPHPDLIIATSPQLLVGLSGWWLARAKRVPFVFEVRDLWPESLTAVGLGGENSILHRSLSGIANFLYTRSDHIVVVTPAFKDFLMKHRRVPATKISVIENGVETSLFAPCTTDKRSALRRQFDLQDRFVVCYVGTMGMAHGLETLLDAAAQLQNQNPEILFLLIGEGSEKERIRELAIARDLANIRFLGQQPREKIPQLISTCDACLVLLKKTEIFKTVIPTKMLEFMSCARPVILGVDGQARAIVEEAGAGMAIEPGNATQLVAAVRQLAANPELCRSLGRNGREYIINRLSRRGTAERYINILEILLSVTLEKASEAAA